MTNCKRVSCVGHMFCTIHLCHRTIMALSSESDAEVIRQNKLCCPLHRQPLCRCTPPCFYLSDYRSVCLPVFFFTSLWLSPFVCFPVHLLSIITNRLWKPKPVKHTSQMLIVYLYHTHVLNFLTIRPIVTAILLSPFLFLHHLRRLLSYFLIIVMYLIPTVHHEKIRKKTYSGRSTCFRSRTVFCNFYAFSLNIYQTGRWSQLFLTQKGIVYCRLLQEAFSHSRKHDDLGKGMN